MAGRLDWNKNRRARVDRRRDFIDAGLDKITDKLLNGIKPPEKRQAWKAKRKQQRTTALLETGAELDSLLLSPRISGAAAELLDVWACTVHTDGCCEPNPGAGGWGLSIEVSGQRVLELSGGVEETTNNRMEMIAAIVALSILPSSSVVSLLSDSQYLIKGMTLWLKGWKAKGFKRGEGWVPNADLWMKLDDLSAGRAIHWLWVKGHNGHAGNERADRLAAEGRRTVLAA